MKLTWVRVLELIQDQAHSLGEVKRAYNKLYPDSILGYSSFNRIFADLRDEGFIELKTKIALKRCYMATVLGNEEVDLFRVLEEKRAMEMKVSV